MESPAAIIHTGKGREYGWRQRCPTLSADPWGSDPDTERPGNSGFHKTTITKCGSEKSHQDKTDGVEVEYYPTHLSFLLVTFPKTKMAF